MFSPFGFSIQELFICYFYCQKTAFICEFQHTPLRNYYFWQPSTTLVNMRFCIHVRNSTRNKNVKSRKPYLRPKMVFLAPETLLYLFGTVRKKISLTLNLMISQTVRNKCLRFGGHVGIQVSYKILRLEVLKDSPILVTSPCFQ
jgi:hypothetical protein